MPNIFDVACYILERKPNIGTMKLQKLCYYAQAWSLVWEEEPLFDEDFEAWENGPVCPQLYAAHRGRYQATPSQFKDKRSGVEFTDDQKETIDVVLRDYGDKHPVWLSELTHKERPWRETRGNLPRDPGDHPLIPKATMQVYYADLIAND